MNDPKTPFSSLALRLQAETQIGYGVESCILWILIVLLVPNVATLLLALMTGACRHDRPWPAWSAAAWVSLLYMYLYSFASDNKN